MQLESKDLGDGVLLIEVYGDLDSAASEAFFKDVSWLLDHGAKHLIVDCGSLELVSSMGLASMMRLHARMKKQGGNVKLAALRGVVLEVIKLMNLHRVVQVYDGVDEARAAIDVERQNQE